MAVEVPEKKRKRSSESNEKPRKKSHVNGVNNNTPAANSSKPSSTESKISISHVSSEDIWAPVVVSSPGLSIPNKISFAPYQSHNQDEMLLHSSDHPRVDYLARQNQGGGLEGYLKHYIAVYDPEKKEVQVVEARHLSMRSTLRAEEEEQQENQASQGGTNYLHLRNRLGLEFGNKKTKIAIQSKAKNMISTIKDPATAAASPEAMKEAIRANPAAAAVLESMTEAAAAAPEKEELQAAIDEAKPRPKRNPESKQAKDHYSVSQLIGDDVIQAVKVKPWFDALDEDEEIQTPSRFATYRLKAIYDSEQDEVAIVKFKILKWMSILIKFHAACRKVRGGKLALPKKAEFDKLGEDSFLLDSVKKQFAPSTGDMTKWQVDNFMTHLAAMSLLVDDFKTNTHDLMQDLQLDPKQVTLYFREIGAKVREMTDSERAKTKLGKVEARQYKIAMLEDELEFPQVRQPVVRGRR